MADTPQQLAFARFLKFWRSVHKISQEELAERLQSSPRHISRLENGSSRPSEAIIQDIAAALELGERDRNHLRIAAGYGPLQKPVDFHDPSLKWLRKAMTLTLKAMDPYPVALLDSSTNILMVNRGWVGFYKQIVSADTLQQASNHYEFLFSRQGAGNIISGWEDTLSLILMSLKQSALLSDDEQQADLLSRLLQHPNVPDDWLQRAARLEPMASFRVQVDYNGALRRFFSVNQTVGALGPNAYVSEPQLTISTLYPEDDQLDLSPLLEGDLQHPLLHY